MKRGLPLIAFCALGAAAGCVDVQQVVPEAQALVSTVQSTAEPVDPAARRPFTGLTLEPIVGGSLFDPQFEPGLAVVKVATGSPAERAGIQPGDRVTRAQGAALASIEQWTALVDAQSHGASLDVEIERARGVVHVTLAVEEAGAGALPPIVRYAERTKGRFVAATVVDRRQSRRLTCARVVELLDGSPLRDAGIEPGTRVFAVDGEPVADAKQLADLVAAAPFGSTLELTIADDAGAPREVRVDLYDPPRRIKELRVPLLVTYRRDFAEDTVDFAAIDFWLFAIYDYRRQGPAVRHRFLWFFSFESGVGDLGAAPVTGGVK